MRTETTLPSPFQQQPSVASGSSRAFRLVRLAGQRGNPQPAVIRKSVRFQIVNGGITVNLLVTNQVFDGLKDDLAIHNFIGV